MPYELVDALTRCWVRFTGRRIELPPGHWLDGPSGDVPGIGDAWLAREVACAGGVVAVPAPDAGLLPSVAALDGPGFTAADLHPLVRDFYERTARLRLDVWSQWSPHAWPGGWLVSAVFARRLGQLSLPLRPLDVAHGMTSVVTPVRTADGTVTGTSWHRRLRATGETVYSGWYGITMLPGPGRAAVRVAFPLPGGRLVVLLRPEATATGGLRLTSGPGAWGRTARTSSCSAPDGRAGGRGPCPCTSGSTSMSTTRACCAPTTTCGCGRCRCCGCTTG